MTLTVLPYYAAALAVMYVILAGLVIRQRFKTRVGLGDRLEEADLQAVAAFADMIGVVDDPRGKPAQPRIDRADRIDQQGAGKRNHLRSVLGTLNREVSPFAHYPGCLREKCGAGKANQTVALPAARWQRPGHD